MKVKVKSEAKGTFYTVEKTGKVWRCNCADYSAKTSLYKIPNYECPHIKKAKKEGEQP
jgi:hypothetical protein